MLNIPTQGVLVEQEIDRVLTQYRESPNLLHVLRTDLNQIEEAILATTAIPSFFDLNTAVGEQLTFIGERMGWPRCHCVCDVKPVFGFECEGVSTGWTIVGFCDPNGVWASCGPFGTAEVCITDDEAYRAFLKVRRYQMLAMFDIDSLSASVKTFFGDQAIIISSGLGRVVVAPGRDLTASEQALLQLYPRVLPVAPGIRIRFHFGPLRVFGFGEGFGGLCEPWADAAVLTTEAGEIITIPGEDSADEDELALTTGELTRSAPFVCETDVKPYGC